MARPTLFQHRKFSRLSDDLGSEALALGHLEFLWSTAGQSGNDLLGDSRDVELAAKWKGEPGRLTEALARAGYPVGPGFIEQRDDGLFYVHDYFDHAPDYVRKRAEREAVRVKSGRTLSEIRSEAGKKGGRPPIREKEAEANGKQMKAICFPDESKRKANEATPSPSPAHTPSLNRENGVLFEDSSCSTPKAPNGVERYPVEFLTFYEAYPRHEAKADALKAWKATAKARPPIAEILAAIERQKAGDGWRKNGGQYIPLPASWLRAGRWADEAGVVGVQVRPPEAPATLAIAGTRRYRQL